MFFSLFVAMFCSQIAMPQMYFNTVFNTVFINPDIYFKGTRLHDPERLKNDHV